MQGLQGIKNRIDSAGILQSIVGTMKAHASSNINQFQNAARASLEYRRVLDMSLYVVLSQEEDIPPLERVDEGKVLHIVFGSDHGLAGRFNERISNFALEKIPNNEENKIILVGQQIFQRLHNDFDIHRTFMQPQTTESISTMVNRLLLEMNEIRDSMVIEEIVLYYNRPEEDAIFVETSEILFPINLSELAHNKVTWKSNRLPIYFAEREKIIPDLIKQYFFITLYRAFCFSLASENASRLTSMQSAEKNIDERLEELNYEYRRERQNSITSELNDVISGFKAIRGSDKEN